MKELYEKYKNIFFFILLLLFLFSIVINVFLYLKMKNINKKNDYSIAVDNNSLRKLKDELNSLKEDNNKLNQKNNDIDKKYNELLDKNSNSSAQYRYLKKEYEQLGKKYKELIEKNSMDKISPKSAEMDSAVQLLTGYGLKKKAEESEDAFVLRSLQESLNELSMLKNKPEEPKKDIEKIEKSIDILFSLTNINGIVAGKNINDVVINQKKIDHILQNSVFVIYDGNSINSKTKTSHGVIEVKKINNKIDLKIIKGKIKEGDFF